MSRELKRPPALAELVALLDTTGWSYLVQHGHDTGDAPFTVVEGVSPWNPLTRVKATWHSRDTGTLRLIHCLVRKPHRAGRPPH